MARCQALFLYDAVLAIFDHVHDFLPILTG